MRQWRKQTRYDVDKEGHLCCVEASELCCRRFTTLHTQRPGDGGEQLHGSSSAPQWFS